ncbi:CinA family protein [Ornithinimicrobium sp. Y1847]|uniref:CinA family protein n=1 Tax=Ornithinimicrobium sp. Y1847 TaxID=3405419 RepID=UPI003B68125B
MTTPAERIVALLRERGETVGTAESLTGGLVCASIVDVPGASAVVRGGIVAYAVDVKESALGVPAELLARHGAVSAECAVAMAQGALRTLGADWALATTGVAGPGPAVDERSGGVDEAGTVHLAVVGEHARSHRTLHLHGSRAEVRAAALHEAQELLIDTLAAGLSVPTGNVVDPMENGSTERVRAARQTGCEGS